MDKKEFRFWRCKEKNGICYLLFDEWKGVEVYYSTRIGGVSPPPYNTLNLHNGRGDDRENVKLNRNKFFKIISLDKRDIVYTKQIHSDIVNIVREPFNKVVGDGMITDKEGLFLGVFTADCLAVFLYSHSKRVIGVVHSGRRGSEKGVVKKAVMKICTSFNIKAEDIEALFGPSIGPCCYEVGVELLDRFRGEYFVEKGKNIYLNIWNIVRDQLKECGVGKIFIPEICTYSRDDLFFSYRKSGERVGENLGIIGMTENR